MSEGAEEAAESALPPEDLQAAGGGDERPGARLSADEGLQADDQGEPREDRNDVTTTVNMAGFFSRC